MFFELFYIKLLGVRYKKCSAMEAAANAHNESGFHECISLSRVETLHYVTKIKLSITLQSVNQKRSLICVERQNVLSQVQAGSGVRQGQASLESEPEEWKKAFCSENMGNAMKNKGRKQNIFLIVELIKN
jgi:hypothetical protein